MSRTRRSVRKEAGFTLVEMAIVLIIIGLIIGAILKGQDLIDNARGKRFASFARGVEVSQWAYYDRFGRFAGDDNKDGQIGGAGDTENAVSILDGELDGFSDQVSLGSSTFYPTFGVNGTTSKKNYMLLTTHSTTPAAFNDGDVIYTRSFDVAIDGDANAQAGSVQAVTAATTAAGKASALTFLASPTWDTTVKGMVYFFD
jgi:prepilin-type N-terminal cleavage/methylation domain-containing protein